MVLILMWYQVDRSGLNEKFCEKEKADTFEAKYGIPYTKLNCELTMGGEIFRPNCSILKYTNLETGKG